MSSKIPIRYIVQEPFARKDLEYIVHTNIFFQRDVERLLYFKQCEYAVCPIITLDELFILKYKFTILRTFLDYGICRLFIYVPKLSSALRYVNYFNFLLRYFDVSLVVYYCDCDLSIIEQFSKDRRVRVYLYYFHYVDSLVGKVDGLVVASRYFERRGRDAVPVPYRYVVGLLRRAGKLVRTFGKELVIDISDIEPRRVLR